MSLMGRMHGNEGSKQVGGHYPNTIAEYGSLGRDNRQNPPHATSSLAQLQRGDIERSEKYVNVEVASKLAGYEDPIKLILPPVLQEAAVVYVRRKYVVGGTASEVPERAPAPVSMVREDVREYRLKRFGGDVDFNINSCLKPDMFKAEMDMKVEAQHAALSHELNRMGYDMLLAEGTDFIDAYIRSSSLSTQASAGLSAIARRFYEQQVFGCLGKYTYPLHNLFAAAKKCTAYDISRAVKSVLILPHGVPELMQYTKAENMRYDISGVGGPQGKPITMDITTGYSLPATTASVHVHIPPALHTHGAAMPTAGKNCLGGKVYVVCMYKTEATTGASLNLETGRKQPNTLQTDDLSDWNSKAAKFQQCFKVYEIDTLHAILGVGDGNTGNLLMQYPRSTVSMDASTESGKMQLRVYLGSILNRPENVFVFRNVAFNGIREIEQTDTSDKCYSMLMKGSTNQASAAFEAFFKRGEVDYNKVNDDVFFCNGTIYKETMAGHTEILRSNDGLLGTLDSIEKCRAFMGAQVFEDQHFMTGLGRQ